MARKKRKADELPPPAASTTASDTASSFRPWPDLPQDILLSIRDRFSLSAPDLLAFSAVCRSWRSAAAAAAAAPFTGPPLLLVPSTTLSRSGSLRWSGQPQCRLKALTVTTRSYRSAISSETLSKKCVGYSNGQLIFVRGKRGVLADVFTGREVHPPEFHAGDRRLAFGILTAPLSSASCLLLLVSYDSALECYSNILCWKPGTDDWSKLELKEHACSGIMTIGVFKDRILAMDSLFHKLTEVEFFPHPSWKYVEVTKPGGGPYLSPYMFDHYMVECGDDLLFVSIVRNVSIEVYRLDWSGSVWVRMGGLGDWCLFIDVGRKFATACHDPMRWGGRDNCIYLAPWGSETWVVVPLDGQVTGTVRLSPLCAPDCRVFEWPSPIWVYPSKLL